MIETEYIKEKSIPEPNTGCWLWLGRVSYNGYGRAKSHLIAHRESYKTFVGPIPTGFTIDHLCEVKSCVNPDHLQAVSLAENIRRWYVHGDRRDKRRIGRNSSGGGRPRKHVCVNGHSYEDPKNVVIYSGRRICIACKRAYRKRQYEAHGS